MAEETVTETAGEEELASRIYDSMLDEDGIFNLSYHELRMLKYFRKLGMGGKYAVLAAAATEHEMECNPNIRKFNIAPGEYRMIATHTGFLEIEPIIDRFGVPVEEGAIHE